MFENKQNKLKNPKIQRIVGENAEEKRIADRYVTEFNNGEMEDNPHKRKQNRFPSPNFSFSNPFLFNSNFKPSQNLQMLNPQEPIDLTVDSPPVPRNLYMITSYSPFGRIPSSIQISNQINHQNSNFADFNNISFVPPVAVSSSSQMGPLPIPSNSQKRNMTLDLTEDNENKPVEKSPNQVTSNNYDFSGQMKQFHIQGFTRKKRRIVPTENKVGIMPTFIPNVKMATTIPMRSSTHDVVDLTIDENK